MKPTIGRIVIYKLSAYEAVRVNKCAGPGDALVCNTVIEGQECPLIITRIATEFGEDASRVNGQVFLDGNFSLWVTSAKEGSEPGQWHWPERK